MLRAVVSEFSSPPVSPERACSVSGMSVGSTGGARLDAGFQHFYDTEGRALSGMVGHPASYYHSADERPHESAHRAAQAPAAATPPSREAVLEHIKGTLQAKYNDGLLSKDEFVTVAKSSLAEVLHLGKKISGFLSADGWQGRCDPVVAKHTRKHAPRAASQSQPQSQPQPHHHQAPPPHHEEQQSSKGSPGNRSASGSSGANNGLNRTPPASSYGGRFRARTQHSNPSSRTSSPVGIFRDQPPTEEKLRQRSQRYRELRRRQASEASNGGSAAAAASDGASRQPLPMSVLRDVTNQQQQQQQQQQKAKGGPARAEVACREEVGSDARRMMTQGLGRLEELSDRILRATSPQEAEIFLHELRSYHFYALVAAGSPPADTQQPQVQAQAQRTRQLGEVVASFEELARTELASSQVDGFAALQMSEAAEREAVAAREAACADADEVEAEVAAAGGAEDGAAAADDAASDAVDGGCVWETHHAADGARYYHNPVTGETTWTRPTQMAEAAAAVHGEGGENEAGFQQQTRQRVAAEQDEAAHAPLRVRRQPQASQKPRRAKRGAPGGGSSAQHPPKAEVVEYIRSLLQPLYNSGAMSQALFLDVSKQVSKQLFSRQWGHNSAEWRSFIRKSIEQFISD